MIKIIVPYAAGGQTDILARTLAQELSKVLGQAVIVENKSGASSLIGTDYVAKAKPDGYTLLIAAGPITTAPSMYPKLPYDPLRDLEPVSMLIRNALVLVTSPASAEKNIADVLAKAKQKPAEVAFASFGNGTVSHMTVELLSSALKVELLHIPYRGSSAALPDVVSGQVPFMFDNPLTALPMIRGGRLTAVAYTGLNRSKSMPNVPTLAESGIDGFETINFYGLFAPAKTPVAILDRLNAEAVKIMSRADVREKFEKDGSDIVASSRSEFTHFLKAETEKWRTVIKQRNIKPD